MSTTPRPVPTSLDQLTLSGVPVVLGSPSPRRRSDEPRNPRRRRPAAAGSPAAWPSERERLSTPR